MGNDAKVKMNVRVAPTPIDGRSWGRTTSRKARRGFAPSERAVSTVRASTLSHAAVTTRATSGAL